MDHKKSQRGFTLIELLVVISIIALLSSVVLASLSSARTRARDTRRLADMRQIQTALELYYDSYGEYPDYDNSVAGDLGFDHSDNDTFISGLVDNSRGDNLSNKLFMTSVPVDPVNISDGVVCTSPDDDLAYIYHESATNGRQGYRLCFSAETDQSDKGFLYFCANGSYPVWCIHVN